MRGEERFLIDCGATALVAMRRFGIGPGCIDAVFLSHLHGDHFGGLPFLLLEAQFVSRRRRPLTIVGPPRHARAAARRAGGAVPGLRPDRLALSARVRRA